MLETSEENAFWTRHYASANEEKVTERKKRRKKIEKKKIKSFAFLWEADVDRSPSSFLCATKIKNKINIFFRLEIKVCCYKVTFEF